MQLRVTSLAESPLYNRVKRKRNKMKKTIPVTLKIEKVHKHKSRFDFEEVAESLFGEMRDTTPEESKALSDYISSISEPTGVNIFDLV